MESTLLGIKMVRSSLSMELRTLRPQGKNPPVDFRTIAKGTAVLQQLRD